MHQADVSAPRLRRMRIRAGHSQAALARLAGASLTSIKQFEGGYLPEISPVRQRVVDVLAKDVEGAGQGAPHFTAETPRLDVPPNHRPKVEARRAGAY